MSGELFRKCSKCGAIPLQDENISYHRFPKPGKTNILRARAWAVYCWPEKKWSSLDSLTQLYKSHKMLCGRHFEVNCFLDSSKRRISKFSVPGSTDYVEGLMNTLRNEENLQKTEPKIIEKTTVHTENLTAQKFEILSVGDVADEVPHLDTEPAENETDNVADPNSDIELTEIETGEAVDLNCSPKKDAFSWEMKGDAIIVPQDEPEQVDDVQEDLTMYCDDDAPIEVKRTGLHEGFHCNNCNGDIVGYRYTCVQCCELDLCASCESSGAHAQHYMLRVPGPRPYNEIQSVLKRIRKLLMKEFDPIATADLDDEDIISVKSEIKSEDENERDVEQTDDITENAVEPGTGEDSRLSPIEPQCSENANSDVVLKNNVTVERQIKITNINLINNSENLDPLEVESTDNSVSTLSDTAKRKLIVRLSDCVKLSLSNELGKRKLCITPSISKQDIKETNTIHRTVLDHSKVKCMRLTEEALLNPGHTVPLQIRSPWKPQTNSTDGNS